MPHRGRVIAAKAIACVGVAVASIPLGFATGVLRFMLGGGTLIDGTVSAQQWAHLGVTNVIRLLIPLTTGLAIVVRAEVT